jgi:hypothetical protein
MKKYLKNKPYSEILNEANKRALELKSVRDDIEILKIELIIKRKLELKLTQRLKTVANWLPI